jgi:hypothetical protein
MLEKITHESFASITSETVGLEAGEIRFQADIEAVSLLRQNTGQLRQPFSLLLQAHDFNNYGQQIYHLSHPELGVLDLFLVPVGPGKKGMRYEVVFN